MTFTWEHVLYRFYDAEGALLYVGITNSITSRFKAHAKAQPWWHQVKDCRIEFRPDRAAVQRAEVAAIRFEHPRYNIRNSVPPPRPRQAVPARLRVPPEQKRLAGIPRTKLPLRQRVSADEWAWMHGTAEWAP